MTPDSWTFTLPSAASSMAWSMSVHVDAAPPDSRPKTRCVFVSIAVASSQPSPDVSAFDAAAEAFQPAPAVLTSVEPFAVAPVTLDQTSGSTTRSSSTPPTVSKAVSARSG